MIDWLSSLSENLEDGKAIVSVTCVDVRGSAPCSVGSRMLVGEDRIWGTIGGGNLEFQAIEQSRRLIRHEQRCLNQDLPLGPLLSQCCGGRVRLVYEKYTPVDQAFAEAAKTEDATIRTNCLPDEYGKWLLAPDGSCLASLGGREVTGPSDPIDGFDGTFWEEKTTANPRKVFIFGGGHIGRALAHILEPVRCKTIVVDPREEVSAELSPRFEVMLTERMDEIAHFWDDKVLAVILTHSHDLDYAWVKSILRSGNSAYCGLIGSKTKRARFVRRLRQDGLTRDEIDHLTSPIGIPGTKSKDPGTVALSTAAQLLPFLTPNLPRAIAPNVRCETHVNNTISENA